MEANLNAAVKGRDKDVKELDSCQADITKSVINSSLARKKLKNRIEELSRKNVGNREKVELKDRVKALTEDNISLHEKLSRIDETELNRRKEELLRHTDRVKTLTEANEDLEKKMCSAQ